MWKKINSYLEESIEVESCKEYLFYNEDWINSDTPNGIRIGFYNDGDFYTSVWNNEFDSYDSDDTKPTHFMEILDFNL
jgi:hypothetical protein